MQRIKALDQDKRGFFYRVSSQQIWKSLPSTTIQKSYFYFENLLLLVTLIFSGLIISYKNPIDPLSNIIYNFSEGVTEVPIDQSSFDVIYQTLLGISAFYLFLMLLTFFSNIWTLYTKLKCESLQNFGKQIIDFHSRVAFWPVNVILMRVLNDIYLKQFDGAVGELVFVVFLEILNYAFAIFGAAFRFDPFKTQDVNSSWNSNAALILSFYKGLASALLISSQNKNNILWGQFSSTFFLLFIRLFSIIKEASVLDFVYLRLTVIFSIVAQILAGFCLIIFAFFPTNSIPTCNLLWVMITSGIMSWFIGSNWIFRKSLESLDSKNNSIFFQGPFLKISVVTYALDKVRIILDGGQTQLSSFDDLIAMKIIADHNLLCKSQECLCHHLCGNKKFLDFQISSSHMLYSKLKYEILHELYQELMKKYPDHIELKLNWAHFEYQYESKIKNALFGVHQLKALHLSLIQRMTLERLLEKINEKIKYQGKHRECNRLDIEDYVDFELSSGLLVHQIQNNTKLYLKFWEHFSHGDISAKKLLDMSNFIEQEADQVKKTWNYLTVQHKKPSHTLYPLYSTYLVLVRNAPYSSEQALQYYQKHHSDNVNISSALDITENNLYEHRNFALFVSMERKSLGRIIAVSHHVREHIGWKDTELINRNVNTLMPAEMHQPHDQILLSYVENSQKTTLNHPVVSFLKTKSEEIVPCRVYISICPQNIQEICFVGIVRLNDPETEKMARNPPPKAVQKPSRPSHSTFRRYAQVPESPHLEKDESMEPNDSRRPLQKSFLQIEKRPEERTSFDLDLDDSGSNLSVPVERIMLSHNCLASKEVEFGTSVPTYPRQLGQTENQNLAKTVRKEQRDFQSSLGSSSRANITKTIEEAIYCVPRIKEKKRIGLSILTTFILTLILLIVYYFQTQSAFSEVGQNVEMMTISQQHTQMIIEINTIIRRIYCALAGTMSMDRYPPNTIIVMQYITAPLLQQLVTSYRSLEESVGNIAIQFQDLIYNQNILLPGRYLTDPSRKVNIFEYSLSFISATERLFNSNPFEINLEDPNMRIILNNTLNGFLLASEQLGPIFATDCLSKINSLTNVLMAFMIIVIIISSSLAILFFQGERIYLKERDDFIDTFIRIDAQMLSHEISAVQEFKLRTSKPQSDKENDYGQKARSEVKQYSKRTANKTGINGPFIKSALLLGLICICLIGGFFFLYIAAGTSQSTAPVTSQISMNLELTRLYNCLRLGYSTLPEYVTLNGTTQLEGVPINQEWEANYNKATLLNNMLVEISQIENSQVSTVNQLIFGDICPLVENRANDPTIQSECAANPTLLNKNGLIGLNSYMLSAIRAAKDQFDNSNRSIQAAFDTLDLAAFIEVEYLDYYWHPIAFQQLQDDLQVQLEGIISGYEAQINTIVFICMGLFTLVCFFSGRILMKELEKERVAWRKMMRQIPFNVLKTHNMMKQYLIKNCEKKLETLKSVV